ncbi:hypothetical protein SAFG77S_09995 [Streptomyces afghaniensis]
MGWSSRRTNGESTSLGFGVVRLAGAVTGRIAVTRHGRGICERLVNDVGETMNIAVLESHHAINLYQVRGSAAIAAQNWVGRLTPLHCTSSGKVLLAHLAREERDALLAEAGLPRLTPRTVTSRKKLEADLSAAREQGYAITLEEYEEGLNALSAPCVRATARSSPPSARRGRPSGSPWSGCTNSRPCWSRERTS